MGTHEANRAEHSGKPVGDDLDDLDDPPAAVLSSGAPFSPPPS